MELRPGQQLVVDLGGVTLCDSTGITILIAGRNRALAARAAIALAAIPERVARMFRTLGLDSVFAICPSARDAADAWARVTG